MHRFALSAITGDGICLCKCVIFLAWVYRCHACVCVAVQACQVIRSKLSAVVWKRMIIGWGVKTLPQVLFPVVQCYLFISLPFNIYHIAFLASLLKAVMYKANVVRLWRATLFKELLFSHGNMLPGYNKCIHEYILDLMAQFVAWKCCLFISPKKMKWITTRVHTNREKKKSHLSVQWNFRWLSKGISCNRLKTQDWKGLIDFVIQSETKLNHFSIPPKWFMNNLISLPANRGVASHCDWAASSPVAHMGPPHPTFILPPQWAAHCTFNIMSEPRLWKKYYQAPGHPSSGLPRLWNTGRALPTMSPILYVRPHACVFIT